MTKIRRIKTALREASQFYVQLHSMGFNVEFVDIGGGLEWIMTEPVRPIAKAA